MALSNPLFDDDIQRNSDVDPPKNEESTDVGELVKDPAQTALSPIETVLISVRKLLECLACLNCMYCFNPSGCLSIIDDDFIFEFWVLEKAFFCTIKIMGFSSKSNSNLITYSGRKKFINRLATHPSQYTFSKTLISILTF